MSDPVRVELVEVLLACFDRTGPGDEPSRPVSQYWSKDGHLLAEFDHAFHAPDVPAYEVARLRTRVEQLTDRLRRYESDTPAALADPTPATESEAPQPAQEAA